MRYVRVRPSYIAALRQGLPLSYLEFWFAKQDEIDAEAKRAFDQPRPDLVDPDYDLTEIRGHWTEGNCDYFATAWLAPDGDIDLVTIEFDIEPLRIEPN